MFSPFFSDNICPDRLNIKATAGCVAYSLHPWNCQRSFFCLTKDQMYCEKPNPDTNGLHYDPIRQRFDRNMCVQLRKFRSITFHEQFILVFSNFFLPKESLEYTIFHSNLLNLAF